MSDTEKPKVKRSFKDRFLNRRTLISFLFVIVFFALPNLYSGYVLRRESQKITNLGGVLSIEGLIPKQQIDPSQNAATYWILAMEEIPPGTRDDVAGTGWTKDECEIYLKPWKAELNALQSFCEQNREILVHARTAAQLDECVWPLSVDEQEVELKISPEKYPSAVHAVGRFAIANTVRLLREGNIKQAEEDAEIVVALSDDLMQVPQTIDLLIAVGLQDRLCEQVLRKSDGYEKKSFLQVSERLAEWNYLPALRRALLGDYAYRRSMIEKEFIGKLLIIDPVSCSARLNLACMSNQTAWAIEHHDKPAYMLEQLEAPEHLYGRICFLCKLHSQNRLSPAKSIAYQKARAQMLHIAISSESVDNACEQARSSIDPITGLPFCAEEIGDGFVIWSEMIDPTYENRPRELEEHLIENFSIQWNTNEWPNAFREFMQEAQAQKDAEAQTQSETAKKKTHNNTELNPPD